MSRRLCALIAVVGALGCAPEPVVASFTSRVVQHEDCKVVGDRPEVCSTEETLLDIIVRIVEREDSDEVWLLGIPKGGSSDRALLGSRDDEGGWLFVDQVSNENAESECSVTDRLEISLAIDPEADPEQVGTDECIALLGREVATTKSTAGCDAVNDPPLEQTQIARRRWEKSPTCKD
jgi:hypothetical protein